MTGADLASVADVASVAGLASGADPASGSGPVVLAVDLGKTSCRVRLTRGGVILAEALGAGAPGLAEPAGAELAFQAISTALDAAGAARHASASDDTKTSTRAPEGAIRDVFVSETSIRPVLAPGGGAESGTPESRTSGTPEPGTPAINAIGIGAAGAATAPKAAAELIRRLRARFDAPVAVLSDALAAHAGAFAGKPGTVLIAGTGAVVFTVTADGAVRQVDGWGPWLGDEGAGRWIGQHGLQAALRAHDGRGPATGLLADAAAFAGIPEAGNDGATGEAIGALPIWVSESGEPARRLGSFAPTVIRRAEAGDSVARGIVDEAVRLLVHSCTSAGEPTVCVTGGLSTHPFFAALLGDALRAAGLQELSSNGDALTGAALVATDHSLPYEKRTTRG
ncbi:N-acetylglucosamine kinase [Glaciibacter sp. 2TAF33]|uniref:N-acetylglucosamine kinase n=1 Tax=Glaciibacter sp. 2TAF33 TaxID=3233015 RepID=UPI003F8EA135